MARGVKYDLQLDPISAPVKSQEGELLMAAGKSEGQANAIEGQTNANAVSFLGATALGAVKGKMESDLDASIKDTLGRLESTREAEFARTQHGQATQIATLLEQSGGLDDAPELINRFKADTKRYTDGLAQGVLTREQVIDRIAADVKKYSAQMPGWASDFRKLAAERTGISNIDVYGVHKALTEKSARERAAEATQQAQLALDKDIAKEYGVGLDAITPELRAFHAQRQQISAAADVSQKRMQLNNMTQEQADKAWGQLGMLRVNEVVAGLAGDIATLGALNTDPNKVVESQEFGLKLSGKLAATAVMLESQIRGFTTPAPGRTAMTEKEASRLIGEVRSTFKSYEDMVKNVEGRNMFANIVKNSKGNMELLMNNFMLANPHTAVLKDIGVLPKLFEAKVALSDDEFERRFPGLLAPMKAIMTGPGQQAYASLVDAGGKGVPFDLPTAQRMNPQAAQVATAEWVQQMETIPKMTQPTPQQANAWVNFTRNVGENYGTVKDGKVAVSNADAIKVNSILADPATQAFARKLSDTQRTVAFAPFVTRMTQGIANVSEQLRTLTAEYADETKNPAAQAGAKIEVTRNPLTGMFELKQTAPKNEPQQFAGQVNPNVTFQYNRPTGWMKESTDAIAAKQRAVALIGDMNKMLTTFTLSASALSGGDVDVNVVRENVFTNYINAANKPLYEIPQLAPKNAAPAAPTSAAPTTKWWESFRE
jgi:hypothetical protein